MRLLVAFLVLAGEILAQRPVAEIPSPAQVLGYEPGSRYTTHASIERYLFALRDAVPDRVKLFPYGKTYEERTLYLAVVTSPENLAHLDEIRSNINKLSDPRTVSRGEAETIARNSPAIVWLSYGVHGNEASSPEAALNVLYQLVSRTDEETRSLLEKLVIVIDPLLNPDGHERYVNYEITHAGIRPVEEKNAVEHNEDFPSGRSNHYYVDLNRDWAWQTQTESKARIKVYREWKPQVHVDFHEMSYNSSYFFFPAYKPLNRNFPANIVEWGILYGKSNAAAFDKDGQSYWTGEAFDLFYPGYGDSWPSLNGAIGMTYEQAGQVGVRVKRTDENILTLRERLENHSTTSFATLRTTAVNREKRLRDFHQFFVDAIAEGATGPVRSFIVNPSRDPSRAASMIDLLRSQGVEIRKATKAFTGDELHGYYAPGTVSRRFTEGSYVIPLDQPAKRLIMTLMEQEAVLTDTMFYDISSWSLPVAYGVETYWSGKEISVPSVPATSPDLPAGKVDGEKAAYAYLIRWESNNAMNALIELLQNDCRTNVAMKEFVYHGERFGRGTIIVPIRNNKNDIHDRVKHLAEKYCLMITAAQTGLTESGIDLGSDRAVRLKRPKILVVTGSPVSSESFGWIWAMFDLQYGLEFVPMKLNQFRSADLSAYTTVVFPDDYGNGEGYRSQLDSSTVQRLKTWVAGGGTFVGIEGGAFFASICRPKLASVKIKEKKPEKKDEDSGKEKSPKVEKEKKLSDEELEKRMTVEQKERKERLDEIPGTMLRVTLDGSHPLGFGYDGDLVTLKTGNTIFELSDRGYNVGMYTKNPHISGYISTENEKLLEETPFLVHEQLGAGNIVLFADDPNFRLLWVSMNKVFLNSVLLMPSIRNVMLTAE